MTVYEMYQSMLYVQVSSGVDRIWCEEEHETKRI